MYLGLNIQDQVEYNYIINKENKLKIGFNDMDNEELILLKNLLDKLLLNAPCKGRSCVGHFNCDYCADESYGESCMIETILSTIKTT